MGGAGNRVTTVAHLYIKLTNEHFINNRLKLKCIASSADIYWDSKEVLIYLNPPRTHTLPLYNTTGKYKLMHGRHLKF